jgi:hypothetical protein
VIGFGINHHSDVHAPATGEYLFERVTYLTESVIDGEGGRDQPVVNVRDNNGKTVIRDCQLPRPRDEMDKLFWFEVDNSNDQADVEEILADPRWDVTIEGNSYDEYEPGVGATPAGLSADGGGGFAVPDYQECWIGGHVGYNRTVPRSEADVEVSSWDGFADALSGYDDGDVVYVTDDLNAEPGLDIKGDGTVVVAGDRGVGGSDGPVIEAGSRGDRLMTIDDGEIRFTGIQLKGQYTVWPGERAGQNEVGLGLHIQGDARAEVDNCDLSGFSAAAIINDSEHPINYHHNHVHDNAAPALGYGIAIRHEGDTRDHIHNCYQNRNRHSINCEEDSYGYHAHHNVVGKSAWNHSYDCHGGEDSIAAHDILIERITVMEPDEDKFVSIRGKPRERVRVRDCQLGAEAGRQIEQRGEIKYGQQDKYDGDEINRDGYSRMSIENIEFDSDCEPRDDIGAGDGFPSQGPGIEPFVPEEPIAPETDTGSDGDDDRAGDESDAGSQRLYLWGDDWRGDDDTRLDFEIVVVGQAQKGDKAGSTDTVIPREDDTTLIDGSVAANSDDAFRIQGSVREVRSSVPDRLNFRLDDEPFEPPLVDTDESEDETDEGDEPEPGPGDDESAPVDRLADALRAAGIDPAMSIGEALDRLREKED